VLVGLPLIAARLRWSVAAAIAVSTVTRTMYVATDVRHMHRHPGHPDAARCSFPCKGGSGALRLAVVGRGEDFHHPGSSHTRARWRLERWSSTTGARIRHERFRSRAPSELTSAMATIQRLTAIAEVAGPHERFRLRAAAS